MVLFFLVWTVASILRPIIMATALAALLYPSATLRKVRLFLVTLRYLLFSNDKKWKKPKEDPASFFPPATAVMDKKTIVFVRHGESTWNDTFNRGDRSVPVFLLCFLPNLVRSVFWEWYFFVTGKADESWFYDSPLSAKGLGQARGVRQFLSKNLAYATPREAELMRVLLGQPTEPKDNNNNNNSNNKSGSSSSSSQLVSSNLRRAIATTVVGFQDRLEQRMEGDSVMILPHLQEISRNPDALSITPAHGRVVGAWTDPPEIAGLVHHAMDTVHHTGNKPIDSNGWKRMDAFCRFCFHNVTKDNIVATGHSLWFRSFFRTYLPHTLEHTAKKRKLVNGGCVGFSLLRTVTPHDQTEHYMIDPKSITVLYGGF